MLNRAAASQRGVRRYYFRTLRGATALSQKVSSAGFAICVAGVMVSLVGWYTANTGFQVAGGIFLSVGLGMFVVRRSNKSGDTAR
jgi:hypothetical protein